MNDQQELAKLSEEVARLREENTRLRKALDLNKWSVLIDVIFLVFCARLLGFAGMQNWYQGDVWSYIRTIIVMPVMAGIGVIFFEYVSSTPRNLIAEGSPYATGNKKLSWIIWTVAIIAVYVYYLIGLS